MQLPAPPTDSLYKFMCIAALLGGISLIIWSDKQLTDLKRHQAKLGRELAVYEEEIQILKEERERLAQHKALRLKTAELKAKSRELSHLEKEISQKTNFAIFQMGLCFFVFAAGLIYWYIKIQFYQDRLLKAQTDAAERALKTPEEAAAKAENRPGETTP